MNRNYTQVFLIYFRSQNKAHISGRKLALLVEICYRRGVNAPITSNHRWRESMEMSYRGPVIFGSMFFR